MARYGLCNVGEDSVMKVRIKKRLIENQSRVSMPQVRKDDWQEFLDWIQSRATLRFEAQVDPRDLHAIQNEFSQDRVNAIPDEKLKYPILVSQDGYVIDGNHRWIRAGQLGVTIPVLRIGLPKLEALDLIRSFPKARYAENALHPLSVRARRKMLRNARKSRVGPNKIDPTQTTAMRRAFLKKIKWQFAVLRGLVYKLVVDEDAFGLGKVTTMKTMNSNPNGCNQHTGPGCGLSMSEGDRDKIMSMTPNQYIASIGGYSEDSQTSAGYSVKESRDYDFLRPLTSFTNSDGEEFEIRQSDSGDLHAYSVDQLNEKKEESDIRSIGYLRHNPHGLYIAVADEFSGKGIATELSYLFRSKHPFHPSGGLSRGGEAVARKVFARLKKEVSQKPTENRFQFKTSPQKIEAFQDWLKSQLKTTVISPSNEQLWSDYATEGYRKGAGRAFDDVEGKPKKQRRWGAGAGKFYDGSREQFLRSSFGRPETVEKIKLLAGRSFDDLENVTEDMATRMSRTLTDALSQGMNPREAASLLSEDIDISQQRAELIARTEIIRAHAEGQLDSMKSMGVEFVGAQVEWSTAGDGRVCLKCSEMEEKAYSIDDARGMIPLHPNCRCAWLPAGFDSLLEKEQ